MIDKSPNTVLIYRQMMMPTPAIRGLNANLGSGTSEFMASLEDTRQDTQSTSSGKINARSLIPTADDLLL